MQELKSPVNKPMSEEEIDENLEESFPACGSPSWSLGTDHGILGNAGRTLRNPLIPALAQHRQSAMLSRVSI